MKEFCACLSDNNHRMQNALTEPSALCILPKARLWVPNITPEKTKQKHQVRSRSLRHHRAEESLVSLWERAPVHLMPDEVILENVAAFCAAANLLNGRRERCLLYLWGRHMDVA